MSQHLSGLRTRMNTTGRWKLAVTVVAAGLTTVFSLSQLGAASSAQPGVAASPVKLASVAQAAPVSSGMTGMHMGSAAQTAAVTPASTSASTAALTIHIKNYAFSPAAATVKVGDTVTWINDDTAPHTVTVSSGPVKFNSGNLAKGQSFTYTFTTAGTYAYYCAVHPDMKAMITVTGSSGSGTGSGTGSGSGTPMPSGCTGAQAVLNTFLAHLYAGHLEEGVGQQASDILNTDQYVKTHTVLVENLLKPLVGGGETTLNTFLTHLYAGHLEEGVGQQAGDILNTDQYVKTHTVLVENMINPLIGSSSC